MAEITLSKVIWSTRAAVFIVVFAVGALLGLLTAGPAHAATFTVNSARDPGTGGCNATECTLREAITAANSASGADTINFAIPSATGSGGAAGAKTISPASRLPVITDTVTIDGYTQTGASPNTLARGSNAKLMIELSGESVQEPVGALGLAGLHISGASDCVIRGLAIHSFEGDGISLGPSFANGEILRVPARNRIEGNFIGTDASGTTDLGNSDTGVFIENSGATIVGGTTSPAERNVISANGGGGVLAKGEHSAGNKIEGNLIGTEKDGVGDLGNAIGGVLLQDASSNFITGNVIAFNDGDGVTVTGAESNAIQVNSIFSNADLGIDLTGISGNAFGDGPTPNDAGPPPDTDSGANGLQNFPVLTSATTLSTGDTIIKSGLKSTPFEFFTIQFFSNRPGEDEGRTFLGEKNVRTGGDGRAFDPTFLSIGFTFTTDKALGVGQNVTATATGRNNTSEFSVPVTVREGIAPRVTRVVPAENATGVSPQASVSAFFSEPMRESTIDATTFKLRKVGSTRSVAAAVSYDATNDRAVLDPTTKLKSGESYVATVTTGAKDLAGNRLDQNPDVSGDQPKTWKFTVR